MKARTDEPSRVSETTVSQISITSPYEVTPRSPYSCARVRGIREDLRIGPDHSQHVRDHLPRAARRILQDYPHFQGDRLVSLLHITGFPCVTLAEAELVCRLTRGLLNDDSAHSRAFFTLHQLPPVSVHWWDCPRVRTVLQGLMLDDAGMMKEVLYEYRHDPSAYARGLNWISQDMGFVQQSPARHLMAVGILGKPEA